MACPHMVTCPLYGQFRTQGFLRVWQVNYCEGAYQTCKRFQLSSEGQAVPDTMLPNGTDLMARRSGAAPDKESS